jgi:hypothetical protein
VLAARAEPTEGQGMGMQQPTADGEVMGCTARLSTGSSCCPAVKGLGAAAAVQHRGSATTCRVPND